MITKMKGESVLALILVIFSSNSFAQNQYQYGHNYWRQRQGVECKDQINCGWFVRYNLCRSRLAAYRSVARLCRKSCGFCKPKQTSNRKEDCKDLNRSCRSWARYNYCITNRVYMSRYCKKSCGLCSCNDRNQGCRYWARIGECTRNPNFMRLYCRKSCGICRVTKPKPKPQPKPRPKPTKPPKTQPPTTKPETKMPPETTKKIVQPPLPTTPTQTKKPPVPPQTTKPPKTEQPPVPPKPTKPSKTEQPPIPPKPATQTKTEPPPIPPKPTTPTTTEQPPIPPKPATPAKTEQPPVPPKPEKTDAPPIPPIPDKTDAPIVPPKPEKPDPPIVPATTKKTPGSDIPPLPVINVKTTKPPSVIPTDKSTRPTLPPETSSLNGLKCGLPSINHIVGGNVSKPGEWPWMVVLAKKSEPEKAICGASLITDRWILTAAHCFTRSNGRNPKDYVLRVGEFDLKKEGDETVVNIDKIIVHQKYSSRTKDYDIALMHTATRVKFSRTVRPVCLAVDNKNYAAGKKCTVAGWGYRHEWLRGGPDKLHAVQIPTVDFDVCKKNMDKQGLSLTDRMMCAGLFTGGKDSCQGDSGGPLMCRPEDGGRWEQVAIVSWGVGCARPNQYGVYTEVRKYIEWVRENTNPFTGVFP